MLHAYIDESGQRGVGEKSSPHFVISAVVVDESDDERLDAGLRNLKMLTRRHLNQELTFKRLNDAHRLVVSKELGTFEFISVIAVIIDKRELTDELRDENRLYLYALRLLLERISWLGQKKKSPVKYTLAHIIRFKTELLRSYESALKNVQTQIKWDFLDSNGGKINRPDRIPQLQIADLVASSIGIAFNPPRDDKPIVVSHLENLYSRIWATMPSKIHSYGLKIFPYSKSLKTAYPEVAVFTERCMAYAISGCPSLTSCRHTSV